MATRKTRSTVQPIRGVSIVKSRTTGVETLRLSFRFKGTRYNRNLSVSPTNDNIRAANRKLEEIKLSIQMGTFDPETAELVNRPLVKEGPTIGERITDRMNRLVKTQEWSITTFADRQKLYRNQLEETFGRLYIKELTSEVFEKWLRTRGDVSVSYISQVLSLLNPIVEKALHEREIEFHPYKHIKRSEYLRSTTTRERKDKINPLNKNEIARFLSACNDNWEHFWSFMFFSGVRLQEATVIRWEDLDFEERTVHVQRAVGFVPADDDKKHKKGSGTRNYGEKEFVKDTKTESSDRVIELVDQAWEALMAMRPQTRLQNGYVFDARVMNDRLGNIYEWPSRQMVRNRWRRALVKAGLELSRSPKQARHTFATMMLFEGELPINVAHAMGHTTTAMIDQHYGKWMKDAKRKRFKVEFDTGQLLDETKHLSRDKAAL